MDVNLSIAKKKIALVYLDKIIVFCKAPQQLINHVRKVVLLLHSADATKKIKKCRFFTDTIEYLGDVICSRRLELASHMTDVIRGHQPRNKLTKQHHT